LPPFIEEEMKQIGTELKLVKIEKMYPDGKMDIKTEGLGIFRIIEFHKDVKDKLYHGATIEDVPFETQSGIDENREAIFKRIGELFKVMNIRKKLPQNFQLLETFRIAQKVGFNLQQKLDMLQLFSELERQNYMIDHLNNLLPMVREMESLRQRIQMNGHFKNILPPKV
ncbi:MAG: LON peptidase substrate-binding domain-containing protein, partial [Bacteroidia bacterium]|nr:LON peptidase substrate-binding domain-containing protein [Bacteroidia bacterium]